MEKYELTERWRQKLESGDILLKDSIYEHFLHGPLTKSEINEFVSNTRTFYNESVKLGILRRVYTSEIAATASYNRKNNDHKKLGEEILAKLRAYLKSKIRIRARQAANDLGFGTGAIAHYLTILKKNKEVVSIEDKKPWVWEYLPPQEF